MPYYPDVTGAPQNSIIGGASLWVMGGKKPEEYKGVAKFFTFLSDTNRQAELHQKSGYLPITKAAYEKTVKDGFYEKNPTLQTPLKELTNKEPTENSRGLRFGNMVQMRDLWAEELEARARRQEDRQGSAGCRGRARQCDVAYVRKDGKVTSAGSEPTDQGSLSAPEREHVSHHAAPEWKSLSSSTTSCCHTCCSCRSSSSHSYSSTGRRARRSGNPSCARTRSG